LNWEGAIADYNEAIRLSPGFAPAFVARGDVRWLRKDYARAFADYQEALRLDPRAPPGYLRLAAAYAACPDAKLRSPTRAIATARRACERWGYGDGDSVQVLAALHAQAGNFDAAVKWQTRALGLTLDEKAKERLGRYRRGKAGEWDFGWAVTGAPLPGE
jgi:tetratricopeptide (TPR) repeat protein